MLNFMTQTVMNIDTGAILQGLWQIPVESLNTTSPVDLVAVTAEPVSKIKTTFSQQLIAAFHRLPANWM